jgi:hypothetical protein
MESGSFWVFRQLYLGPSCGQHAWHVTSMVQGEAKKHLTIERITQIKLARESRSPFTVDLEPMITI